MAKGKGSALAPGGGSWVETNQESYIEPGQMQATTPKGASQFQNFILGAALFAMADKKNWAERERLAKLRDERALAYTTYLDMFRTAPGARFSETIIGKPQSSGGLVSRGNSQAQAINQMGAALNVPNLMRGAIGD
jgi:hypothetical protein